MPELPEVAGFRRCFDKTARNKTIKKTLVLDERILHNISRQKLVAELTGNRFTGTYRHGKYLFAAIEDSGWLVLHFGMTGCLESGEHKKSPPEHTRLLLVFHDGSQLAYICTRMLGKITHTQDRNDYVATQELGPDALSETLDSNRFLSLVGSRRAGIKATLMDQSVIAGIGNVYADEILFQSSIHPEIPANELSGKDLDFLFRTMKRVLEGTVRHSPSEFPDGYLTPHREEGAECPHCGAALEKIHVSGRPTYVCPDRQPQP